MRLSSGVVGMEIGVIDGTALELMICTRLPASLSDGEGGLWLALPIADATGVCCFVVSLVISTKPPSGERTGMLGVSGMISPAFPLVDALGVVCYIVASVNLMESYCMKRTGILGGSGTISSTPPSGLARTLGCSVAYVAEMIK